MTDSERAEFELMRDAYEKAFGPPPVGAAWSGVGYAIKTPGASEAGAYTERFKGFIAGWVARRAPRVQETVDRRAQKLKGLQVMIGATSGVPEAIDLARSRFIEAYGRSPLHDDLAYACLLIDAYGCAPAAPVPRGNFAELKRLAESCPELNMSNYGPDDVDELNNWAIEIAICAEAVAAPTTQETPK